MDKGITVNEIQENTQIEGVFLVREKNNGVTRSGKPYLALVLSDRTGEVKGRVWDNAARLSGNFSQGDIVQLRAHVVLYQGSLQLNVSDIRRCSWPGALSDFLPAAPSDPDENFAALMEFVSGVGDPHLRALLEALFDEPAFVTAFKTAPAAKSIHHDYIGGLLEHTLQVTRLAHTVAGLYPHINRDLVTTGAIIHDIGKTSELAYETRFDYTDAGRLIGHIMLGIDIISGAMKKVGDFPEELALVVKHLILSHHGQYEFGSPKRPKTPEAMLLNYVDDMDSKLFGIAQFIRKEKRPDTKWTSYHKLFDRYIYTDTFIDDADNADKNSA